MPAETLIVCRDEAQKREAILAFGFDDSTMYTTLHSALTGYRFNKIIVIAGGPWSEHDLRQIREDLPTKLVPRGELYVL